MGKNIIIKLLITLIVAALVYSVFWFFKVSQIEKQISGFINKNSAYISVGEIGVSGFPLQQKITIKNLKFSIPNPVFGENQIIVNHLEAEAGIFSTDFNIELKKDVEVRALDGKTSIVEFASLPKISAVIKSGVISKINYSDLGVKLFDSVDRSLIYSASSSNVTIEITVDDIGNISTKIEAKALEIEGFDVKNVYSNLFEKKIIDGLKTGEISLGNLILEPAETDLSASSPVAIEANNQATAAPAAVNQNPANPVNTQEKAAELPKADPAILAAATDESAKIAQNQEANPAAQEVAVDPNLVEVESQQKIIEEKKPVKSNLSFTVEYALSLNKSSQDVQIPTDPTQIQEVPVQYNKSIKISNLEFSNEDYKIMVNCDLSSSIDDRMPYGSFSIKIENLENLTKYLSQSFLNISKADKTIDEVQASDIIVENEALVDNSYNEFLTRVSANLNNVAIEISKKNLATSENLAVFDIKREKNLEFLVNESSMREVLGKF